MKDMKSKPDKKRDAILLSIAQEVLSLETLETRKWDTHDFHEHAVWSIKEALEKAYQAGKESVQ
jgi:hypothetical protein